jgi:hypothetical protein
MRDGTPRAVMPNMLAHRRGEGDYYRASSGPATRVGIVDNPHAGRRSGRATAASAWFYLRGAWSPRSRHSRRRRRRATASFAADFVGVPDDARVYVELVYPHFHGDTVHFGARPTNRGPVLVHYSGGLFDDGSAIVSRALGADSVVQISRDDAVEQYAGNSRQVRSGVLVPDGVSDGFIAELDRLGLASHRVPLFELFGRPVADPPARHCICRRGSRFPPPPRSVIRRREISSGPGVNEFQSDFGLIPRISQERPGAECPRLSK